MKKTTPRRKTNARKVTPGKKKTAPKKIARRALPSAGFGLDVEVGEDLMSRISPILDGLGLNKDARTRTEKSVQRFLESEVRTKLMDIIEDVLDDFVKKHGEFLKEFVVNEIKETMLSNSTELVSRALDGVEFEMFSNPVTLGK